MNMDVCLHQDSQARQELFWTTVDQAVRQMIGRLIEKVLRVQQDELIQAKWNQRFAGRTDYRNGTYKRSLSTPYGTLVIHIPRCRLSKVDCSGIFASYQRRIRDVDRILRHAYLLGCSTRGAAELAEQVFGGSLSHQTVSRLMRWLDEQLVVYRSQPIAPVYRVVHIDGMYVDAVGGKRVVMLVSGRRYDGRLEVLGFCVGRGERCVKLLKDLRRRGLEGVELFVSDESGPIRSALMQAYPEVTWQHCTFHRLQALRKDVGATDYRDLMAQEAGCIFRCPSLRAAYDAAKAWAKRWKGLAAWAVRKFMDGLEDSLMFYSLPKDWWKKARTNNPQERENKTLRMRLRPMGAFHDDAAIERAIFGQLARWHLLPELTHNT